MGTSHTERGGLTWPGKQIPLLSLPGGDVQLYRDGKMLFLTQQAVSKNIRNLEEELGFPLFLRTSRSVELTEQGRQCYELISSWQPVQRGHGLHPKKR